MASHLLLLIIFCAFVSIVFAALLRETIDAQAKLAARMFVAFVVSAIVLGWLMYPLPI
jgi:hypothetical protein